MEDVLASLTTDISTLHQPWVLNKNQSTSPVSFSQEIHTGVDDSDGGTSNNGKNSRGENSRENIGEDSRKTGKHTVGNDQFVSAVSAGTADSNDSKPALLLTFDDGYIDNYTFAMPLLEQFVFQGSFFIPGKTFTEHKLLDVNKIHYILASAEDIAGGIKRLVADLFDKMDFYRCHEFDYPSNSELYKDWAVPNRFDSGDVVFVKRILQTVLPEQLRNRISSDLFETYVGVSETQLAYELYMTEDQIRALKRRGHFIGLHGYDHYWLGRLSRAEMERDVDKALSVMTKLGVIEPKAWVMNYPYGSYNEAVLDYIKSRGAVMGLTTEVRVAEIEKDEPMKLPRLDCNDFPPRSENYKKFMEMTLA